MNKFILGVILCFLSWPAFAACPGTLLLRDANGITANAKYSDDGSGNCIVNVIDPNPVPAGTNNIGNVGFAASPSFGATPGHAASAASNNSTNIKASAGTLYSLTVMQTTTTFGDFRLYDTAGAPTCSSATGVVASFPIQSNAISPGFSLNFGAAGMKFSNGIAFCLTGALGDSDNSNFVTGVTINWTFN